MQATVQATVRATVQVNWAVKAALTRQKSNRTDVGQGMGHERQAVNLVGRAGLGGHSTVEVRLGLNVGRSEHKEGVVAAKQAEEGGQKGMFLPELHRGFAPKDSFEA